MTAKIDESQLKDKYVVILKNVLVDTVSTT